MNNPAYLAHVQGGYPRHTPTQSHKLISAQTSQMSSKTGNAAQLVAVVRHCCLKSLKLVKMKWQNKSAEKYLYSQSVNNSLFSPRKRAAAPTYITECISSHIFGYPYIVLYINVFFIYFSSYLN